MNNVYYAIIWVFIVHMLQMQYKISDSPHRTPPPPPQLTFTEACASKSPFVNIPLSITENGKVYSYTLAYGFLTRLILIYLKFQREFESVGPLGQGVGNVPRQNHDNPRINIPPLSKRHYTGKLRQENLFLTYYDPLMIFPECTDLDGQI